MYDVQTDPKQLKSIYDDPKHAAVQRELEAELTRLRRELQVPDEDPPQTARGPKRRKPATKKK